MEAAQHSESQPTASEPGVPAMETSLQSGADAEHADSSSSDSSSSSASEGRQTSRRLHRSQRPKLQARKSSGTIIVLRGDSTHEQEHEYGEGDARAMSPRRSSEEVDRLEEGARHALMEQAKQLQENLMSLVDRVESVKSDHEKLEGGNKFLQSYIGQLMQTSKITSTSSTKAKGKGRTTK